MNIEKPTWKDVSEILALGKLFHAESAFSSKSFSEDKVELLVQSAINDENDLFIRVAREENEIVGGILGICAYYWFSDTDKIASDMAVFVHPDRRGLLASRRLVEAFKEWAKEKGASAISISISAQIEAERAEKLFERIGVPRVGTLHMAEVN